MGGPMGGPMGPPMGPTRSPPGLPRAPPRWPRPRQLPPNCVPRARPISLCWSSPAGNCARRWRNDDDITVAHQEEAMELSRRDLAAIGVLALGSTSLIGSARAEGGDDDAVKKTVEELKAAYL